MGRGGPSGAVTAGKTAAMPPLTIRTLVLACWLLALLVHGDREPLTAALVLALAGLWALALIRDRGRSARSRHARPSVAAPNG